MKSKRILSLLLCVCMLAGMMSVGASAITYNEAADGYYKVVSKQDWELAPGITESEIVLNNESGSHRQVAHVVEADLNNEYVKVMPSYGGMKEALDNKDYGVQVMSEQVKWAEKNGYGNIVAAMNISLSWYDSDYYVQNPSLVGEPLGYLVMDGNMYVNSKGQTSGAQTCVVINFDEKDGEARPADMPKVQVRSSSEPITGWEEQVIPANFGYLVKDGKNVGSTLDHNSNNGASRSFIGIKEDGTFVMVMNDGRQSPYSAGFTTYEMAEFMLSLGCVAAVNGDGGGSSTFLSQRPGEAIALNCSPSDGSERPTTHGVFVISTAPATGEFIRATITAENDYYTPGSTVEFTALGTDLVGTEAAIPADATWQLADASMGTIENGVFVSNGTIGTATAQMVYNGKVVGEGSVEIVIPETFTFTQSVMTVPFGKEVTVGMKATINGGLQEVVLGAHDTELVLDNEALGTIDGFTFTAVDEANAPEDVTGTLTATLKCAENLVATASVMLGKGSEVLFDFEDSIDGWVISEVNEHDKVGEGRDFINTIDHVTVDNGQVHDGNGSMHIYTNGLHAEGVPSGGYAQTCLYLEQSVVIKNAKSIGFWVYMPDEYYHAWIRVHYWYDSNNDGTYDKKNNVNVINQPTVYQTVDEDGWYYYSVDVSAYESIMITGLNETPANASKCDANNYRFIEFMFPHTNTNDLWKTNGTINGPYNIYVDNITVDYSDAVDDREPPVFGNVSLLGDNETVTAMAKRSPVTTAKNSITVSASVAENTTKTNATGLNAASAKAYVDGVEVPSSFANGKIFINDVKLADGMHRVKFEISDYAGNKAVVVRLVNVQSGVEASTVKVAPRDAALDRLYGGSVYWMDVKATDIETIKSVKTVIDLNTVNHWELDHMELANGFTSSYTINELTNTATITISRTGKNEQTGEAVIASLPIRIASYENDFYIEGYDAASYWNEYAFWPQDLKVDVDLGEIIYVDGYKFDVLNTFSNEEFSVDTEMYCPSASMDATFKAERGTLHVHTPVAVDDKAANCLESGITGRTYCEVCDSVVEWGTVVPAAGHNFGSSTATVRECVTCGDAFLFSGNTVLTGWQKIDGKDYYADDEGKAVNGEATVDGHTYIFTDYVLTGAAWENDGVGITCWWAGEQYFNEWVEIGGNTYHFTGFYADTGYKRVAFGTNVGMRYCVFDENGVFQSNYTGAFEHEGKMHFAKNGKCTVKGLVKDNDGNYYYVNSAYYVIQDTSYNLSNEAMTNGLLPTGIYYFGEDGKLVQMKNGLVFDDDGEIRFYVNNVATYAGVVADAEGNLYYINSSKKAVKNTSYYIYEARTNGLVKEGVYEFGPDGKMVKAKNGLVFDADGEIRYYVDNVPTYAGVVQDKDGNLYYINSSKKAVKNTSYFIYAARANGLVKEGLYSFDSKGVMSKPKKGLVFDDDGEIRYYVDNVPTYAGVVQDKEGNLYYINSSKKAVKNTTYFIYESKANGLVFEGVYAFDSDGKMLDGLCECADGEIRYYENGVPVYAGVVCDIDGNLYYINSSKKAVKDTVYYIYAAKTNGFVSEGSYRFDANGKMVG